MPRKGEAFAQRRGLGLQYLGCNPGRTAPALQANGRGRSLDAFRRAEQGSRFPDFPFRVEQFQPGPIRSFFQIGARPGHAIRAADLRTQVRDVQLRVEFDGLPDEDDDEVRGHARRNGLDIEIALLLRHAADADGHINLGYSGNGVLAFHNPARGSTPASILSVLAFQTRAAQCPYELNENFNTS